MEGTSEAHQKTSPQTMSESTQHSTSVPNSVPKYYRDTKNGREVGVIVGKCPWSSNYDGKFRENLIFHKDLVETILKKEQLNREGRLSAQNSPIFEDLRRLANEINTILKKLGIQSESPESYELVSTYTLERLSVQFVSEGKSFCIDLDDLSFETIVYFDSLKILQEF